jgi:hypothetical protein
VLVVLHDQDAGTPVTTVVTQPNSDSLISQFQTEMNAYAATVSKEATGN